jgi:flagellar hook-associated protein 3 FlgL
MPIAGLPRVTQNLLVGTSVTSLQRQLSRLAGVQEQLSTGKVLNRPSDSPTDTTAAMRMRSAILAHGQYARNAEDGLAWSGLIDQTIGSMTDEVRRARELALQGASGAASPAAREALAAEVEQIRAGLLTEANTGYLGRPIFGGTTAGATAYDASGAFVGSPGSVLRAVGDGVQVRVDIAGPDVLGDGPTSVFAELDALVVALRGGDEAGIRTGLDQLADRLDTLTSAQALAGATSNRLERAVEKSGDAVFDLTAGLTRIEDVDLARASVDLQLQEVAYQAALAATARVMQPSLVDFLR